jgi:hydrogenase nickel incorporation protein HypB
MMIRKPGENIQSGAIRYHSHEHSHGGEMHSHPHEHEAGHDHDHPHSHDHSHGREISLELDIMRKNDLLAERNRGFFEARGIRAFNLVSSPGSGKTTILERTIREYAGRKDIYVIEGDQQTMLDADRIHKTGAPVVQVNTGNGCHLDAAMVNSAVKSLDVKEGGILMIENVGNLVCPALFDLGETRRVVIISVTEGADKPLKYPNMFRSAQLCLVNKTDLLPYVDFDVDEFRSYALRVNPDLTFIELSAKLGTGFQEWIDWIDLLKN